MDEPNSRSPDGTPIFDTLDLDLVVKVLAHTAFSEFPEPYLPDTILTSSKGPFFIFFIPVFYFFQGAKLTDPVIVLSAVYYVVISVFCEPHVSFGISQTDILKYSPNGIHGSTATKEALLLVRGDSTGENKL